MRGRLEGELLIRQRRDGVAQLFLIAAPVFIDDSQRRLGLLLHLVLLQNSMIN
jgi:hypothetical protein